jgi:hypothetical protein
MDATFEDARLGPYRLLRLLAPSRFADRWVALHERHQTTHVIHVFEACHDRAEERRFVTAMERVASLRQAHLQPVVQYSLTNAGRPWAVTEYIGSQVGLVTLESLRVEKGGAMASVEVERVMNQLLSASIEAHANAIHHGPIHADEVLVDRSGSVAIEMYGVARILQGLADANSEVIRDEVRSCVELGYFLLTGLPAEEPRIPAGRLLRKGGGAWDAWIEEGLSAVGGYESPADALAQLPGQHRDGADSGVRVRTVIGRVRSVLGPRSNAD